MPFWDRLPISVLEVNFPFGVILVVCDVGSGFVSGVVVFAVVVIGLGILVTEEVQIVPNKSFFSFLFLPRII